MNYLGISWSSFVHFLFLQINASTLLSFLGRVPLGETFQQLQRGHLIWTLPNVKSVTPFIITIKSLKIGFMVLNFLSTMIIIYNIDKKSVLVKNLEIQDKLTCSSPYYLEQTKLSNAWICVIPQTRRKIEENG